MNTGANHTPCLNVNDKLSEISVLACLNGVVFAYSETWLNSSV